MIVKKVIIKKEKILRMIDLDLDLKVKIINLQNKKILAALKAVLNLDKIKLDEKIKNFLH